MTEVNIGIAAFTIAQKHAAAVAKYRENYDDSYTLRNDLRVIKAEADSLGVPYIIPDNFLSLVDNEDQYYNPDDSSDYVEPESSEYY